MLDYILSKMNLLILVVSMFAIIAFFSAGLSEIVKINEANLRLRQITSMAESIANSNSSCDTATYPMADSLNTGGADFYYIMKISKVKLANKDGTTVNNVIFSMFPRMKQQNAFAANSFRTNAEIRIYSPDYIDKKYPSDVYAERCENQESCSAIADPQAQANLQPLNAVVFIKERVADQFGKVVDYLHIIPCNVQRCEDRISYISDPANNLLNRKFLCGQTQGAAP